LSSGLPIGGEWICPSRCKNPTIMSPFLVIRFTGGDLCLLLPRHEYVFFLGSARCEFIHLLLAGCILTDEPSAPDTVNISHFFIFIVCGNGSIIASKLVNRIFVVKFGIKAFSQGRLRG